MQYLLQNVCISRAFQGFHKQEALCRWMHSQLHHYLLLAVLLHPESYHSGELLIPPCHMRG